MRFIPVAAILCGSIAGVAALAPQDPAQQMSAPLAPGRAIIAGRVIEAGTTRGVPDAVVRLAGPSLGSAATTFPNGTTGGDRSVLTDGNGRFVFRDVPAGPYLLLAEASGYLQGSYGQTRPSERAQSIRDARPLDVGDADRPLNVTVQLWRPAGIGGIVRDEFGDPIAGVGIAVIRRSTDWTGVTTTRELNPMTDDRGMYHVDVAPGDFQIAFLGPLTTVPAAAVDAFQQARVDGGPAMSSFMAQVEAGGGVLARGYGSRIGNFVVIALDQLNRPVLPPFTDRNERWMFYPTTYAPGIISVASGEERTSVNLDLRAIPIRRVTGHIADANGASAANVAVRLVAADPAVQLTAETRLEAHQALTDGAGNFTFIGVAPGTYALSTFRRISDTPPQMQWASTPVSVADADVTGVDVRLQSGVSISGRIASQDPNPPSSQQLRRITVELTPIAGSPGAQIVGRVDGVMNDSGQFVAGPMAPGPYSLLIPMLPEGWTIKSITADGKDAFDPPLMIGTGGVRDLVVTLTDKIINVDGIVRVATGEPASDARVVIFPVNRSLWTAGTTSRRMRTASTDRYGHYVFRSLPAGEYAVAAVQTTRSDLLNPQVLDMLMPAATRVTLADGDSRSQDLRATLIR